jgi:hypothetical protein
MSMHTVIEALALVTLWGLRRLTGGYRHRDQPLRTVGAPRP